MSKTVKIEDIKKIMDEGIKIRHKSWDEDEYVFYNSKLKGWEGDEGFCDPLICVNSICEGEYEYFQEPKKKIMLSRYRVTKPSGRVWITADYYSEIGVYQPNGISEFNSRYTYEKYGEEIEADPKLWGYAE